MSSPEALDPSEVASKTLCSFRSIPYSGSVLDLDRGSANDGKAVSLKPEGKRDDNREPQKWLLQIQKECRYGRP